MGYLYGATKIKHMTMLEWLWQHGHVQDRKTVIRALVRYYGLTQQGAEEIYNEWRKEYIEC